MRDTGLRESWRGFFPTERLSYREARRARRQPSWAYVAKLGCHLLPGSCLARISAVRGRMFQELRHQWAHGGCEMGGIAGAKNQLSSSRAGCSGCSVWSGETQRGLRQSSEALLTLTSDLGGSHSFPLSLKQQMPASTPPSLTSSFPHLLNPRS